jgi:hypothetical protein
MTVEAVRRRGSGVDLTMVEAAWRRSAHRGVAGARREPDGGQGGGR